MRALRPAAWGRSGLSVKGSALRIGKKTKTEEERADYPVLLRLRGRPCVVAGGGEVAFRKVKGLLECGAKVKVVSPELGRGLKRLAESGKIRHLRRPYRRGDMKGAFLAIGATDDAGVNQRLQAEAVKAGVLVNIVDKPELCTFTLPARIRRGPLTIAVSTGGASPALSRRLRELLEKAVGPEYEEFAALMGELREKVKQTFPTPAARKRAWEAVLNSEVLSLLREGKIKEAKAKARACLSSPSA